jgi:hypothetical protein
MARRVQVGSLVATRTTLSLAALITLASSGCAAQQRRTAGELVAATGALAVITGLSIASGCSLDMDDDPETEPCDERRVKAHPEIGLPVTTIGLGVVVVGGVVYGTGVPTKPSAPPPATRSTRPLY